ncbi:MAG: hypothetical protein HZC48_12185 [Nitrospirae bacterium]|nr:hypothetical protein [Nitrospirota bacterium]
MGEKLHKFRYVPLCVITILALGELFYLIVADQQISTLVAQLKEKGTEVTVYKIPLSTLLYSLIPNLMASLLAFMIGLFFLRRSDSLALAFEIKKILPKPIAPDLSKVEKLLEDTVGKWKTWKPEGVCSIDDIGCPIELRKIYEKYDLTFSAEQACLKRVNILLLERLKYFNRQLAEVENGKWLLMASDGNLPTDADLTYNIITDEFLTDKSRTIIKASTVFPYIEWWITSMGLKYLEKQRDCDVERIFLFPDGVYTLLFSEFPLEQKNINEANALFFNLYPSYRPNYKMIRIILYIHYLLNIKVQLLSSAMLKQSSQAKKIVNKWESLDTVIIQKENHDESINNICAIQMETTRGNVGKHLIAEGGTVYFKNDEINDDLLSDYAILLSNATEFEDLKKNFNDEHLGELVEFAKLLGIDVETKKDISDRIRLDNEATINAINKFIID